MGEPAHASGATERLPHPSRFSADGNSYGVRLIKQKSPRHIHEASGRENRKTWGTPEGQRKGHHQPADDYCLTGVQPPRPARFSVLQV
jgi:rRNA maturation protein Nop10